MMDSFLNVDSRQPVLVLGAAGMDVVGRLQSDLKPATSNPARIRRSYGGVARNVAENLARLGQPVRLISVVGMDKNGDEILEHTANAGVDVSGVLRSVDYPTGYYMGVLGKNGILKFAVDDMRLMAEITTQYLKEREDLFKSASMVFVDANLPVKALRTANSLAKRAKIPICADTASSTLAERLFKFLPRYHLLTANSKEAGVLTNLTFEASDSETAAEAARSLVNQGVRIALVTLAEYGVVYATSETTGHISAIRTSISDPTGAGDAMTAAVLFALLNKIELDDAIRLGISAASLTLRHPGSVYPTLSLEGLYDQLLI